METQKKVNSVWRPLLFINIAAAFYSVGTVWLVQLNWILWRYVGAKEFSAYHRAWWHGIWWAIFPIAGISFLGICAQLKWRPPLVNSGTLWAALLLQLLIYLGTAFYWGPGQASLHQIILSDGSIDFLYKELLNTQWIRVALITASGLLELWIALKSFPLTVRK